MKLFWTLQDVNKFTWGLTVKKHFLTETQTNERQIPTLNEETNKEIIMAINNKEENTFILESTFQDHCTLHTLIDLQEHIDVADCTIHTTANRNRIPNQQFYPLQSRTDVMDTFQSIIERELKRIHDKTPY